MFLVGFLFLADFHSHFQIQVSKGRGYHHERRLDPAQRLTYGRGNEYAR